MPKDEKELPADYADNPAKYADGIEQIIGNPAAGEIMSRAERDHQELQYWREREVKRNMHQGEVTDDELNEYLANNAEDWWAEYKYTEQGDAHLRDLFLKNEPKKGQSISDKDVTDTFTQRQRDRLNREQSMFDEPSGEDE